MQSAHFIANSVLKEPRAYYPIMAAPAIFSPGWCQYLEDIFRVIKLWFLRVSQVLEQLFL